MTNRTLQVSRELGKTVDNEWWETQKGFAPCRLKVGAVAKADDAISDRVGQVCHQA